MKNNTMKNNVKFNRLPDNKDFYETAYVANYESKFDLGEFKILNMGYGSKPYRIELNGDRFDFSELYTNMRWLNDKHEFRSLKNCKERITLMISELSKLSYWITK